MLESSRNTRAGKKAIIPAPVRVNRTQYNSSAIIVKQTNDTIYDINHVREIYGKAQPVIPLNQGAGTYTV